MPDLTITILCENTAAPKRDILGEHGFAALIERGSETILFDTGQGHTLMANARAAQKNLRSVSKICLSHGHFDHTGGLAQALNHIGPRDIHAHPDVFATRFARTPQKKSFELKPAGIPHSRETLEALGARFIFNTHFSEIAPGIFLTGEVPRTNDFEQEDRRLVVGRGSRTVQDTLKDDQSLVVQTRRGLVVVFGCAHAGVINILSYIAENLAGQHIHMVLGGTHLGFLDTQQISRTVEELRRFSIDRIGASHCTGMSGAAYLYAAFRDTFFFANAGTAVTV